MDLDGPRSSESTSMEMEIDDDNDAVSCSHTQHRDGVQTSSSVLSGLPFAGSNTSSHLSPPAIGEAGDIYDRDHGLAPWQPSRDRLPSSQSSRPEAESRKRKIMHLSPDEDHDPGTRGAHSSADSGSSSTRRTRLRLHYTRRDREFEFTPLLFMSPRRELGFAIEEEETLTSFQYALMAIDSDPPRSSVIRRYPPLDERGPRILQSSSYLPTADDLVVGAHQERRRLDSASSFEQVAMASTTTPTTSTNSSLSTLSNFSLPCPFEDSTAAPTTTAAELPSEPVRGTTIVKVHERGVDARPSFPVPSTRGGRTRPSGAAPPLHVHLHFHPQQHGSLSVEPTDVNILFNEAICESPVSFHPGVSPPTIDPDNIRRVISAPTGGTQREPVTFRSMPATT